jgi:hypothetical protein
MSGSILKIGDKVTWRGSWGRAAPQTATVVSMDLCEQPGEKYGLEVTAAFWAHKDRLCVGLDNGHWAYGYQIEKL